MAKIIILSVYLILLNSITTYANNYYYDVNGQFEVENLTQYVSGNMLISDQFLVQQEVIYYFDIVRFDIKVSADNGSFNFSGDLGALAYVHQVTDPQTGQKFYEQQWSISNAAGDSWLNPYSPSIFFYSSDMTEYWPTSIEHYGVLAPIIDLTRPFFATQYPDPNAPGFSPATPIRLTRIPAPVPEPSTALLVSAGFLIPYFVTIRRKNKKSMAESNACAVIVDSHNVVQ